MNALYNNIRCMKSINLFTKRNLAHTPGEDLLNYYKSIIGNRETVGFGINGTPCYLDNPGIPMPAIRYKEPTAEILALREKERGDWRLLTIEEKKKLYRSSFCQTYAEFTAPKNEWMRIVGYSLMLCSLGIWLYMLTAKYVYSPLPDSFTPECKRAQLKRMIHLHVNPITGLTSNWDYEKMDWKVKRWDTPDNPFLHTDDCKESEDDDD